MNQQRRDAEARTLGGVLERQPAAHAVLLARHGLYPWGAPPAEESSLRSRGEVYRRYQRETPVFVPWFPKRSSTA